MSLKPYDKSLSYSEKHSGFLSLPSLSLFFSISFLSFSCYFSEYSFLFFFSGGEKEGDKDIRLRCEETLKDMEMKDLKRQVWEREWRKALESKC